MSESKPIRPAATVLLLRDGPQGLEVFMVVRHDEIDFMAGALVFPGGKVDETDRDPEFRNFAAAADELSDVALATRVAAIREAFEEAGILLARPRGREALISADRLKELRPRYRKPLHAEEITMLELVKGENLELACDLLVRFAHWIGPKQAPKRFDTHFYLAAAPQDQLAVHDGTESVDSVWIRPEEAMSEADAKRRNLVFPTRMNVAKLGRSQTAAEALERARASKVVTVLPQIVDTPDGPVIRIPPEADYDISELPLKDLPPVRHGKGQR